MSGSNGNVGDVERCARCEALIKESQELCSCGHPTRFMSFEARKQYEVEQWRAYKNQMATTA